MLSPTVTETVRHGRLARTLRRIQRNAGATLDAVALDHATRTLPPLKAATVARVTTTTRVHHHGHALKGGACVADAASRIGHHHHEGA